MPELSVTDIKSLLLEIRDGINGDVFYRNFRLLRVRNPVLHKRFGIAATIKIEIFHLLTAVFESVLYGNPVQKKVGAIAVDILCNTADDSGVVRQNLTKLAYVARQLCAEKTPDEVNVFLRQEAKRLFDLPPDVEIEIWFGPATLHSLPYTTTQDVFESLRYRMEAMLHKLGKGTDSLTENQRRKIEFETRWAEECFHNMFTSSPEA